jgi:hypothetical protein
MGPDRIKELPPFSVVMIGSCCSIPTFHAVHCLADFAEHKYIGPNVAACK